MLNWFKKKPPPLQSISPGWGKLRVGYLRGSNQKTVVAYLNEKSIVRHPELPVYFHLGLKHVRVAGQPHFLDPAYGNVEEKLNGYLDGPPRIGLLIYELRDQTACEWLAYLTSVTQASLLAAQLRQDFPDLPLKVIYEFDPDWTMYHADVPLR